MLCGMWNLPGPGIEPVVPCIGRWNFIHCTTREIPPIHRLLIIIIKKTYCPPFVCHSHNLGFESAHLIFSAPGLFDFMCFRKGRAPSTTLWSEPQISCRGVKSTCLRRSIRPLLPVFHPVPPGYVALAVHKGSIGHRQVGMEFLFTWLARW